MVKMSTSCSRCREKAILFASDPYLGYETDTESLGENKRRSSKYCLSCLQLSIREHPMMTETQKTESLTSLSFVTQMLSNCSIEENNGEDSSSSSSCEIIVINDNEASTTSSSSCSCDECKKCHDNTSSTEESSDGDIVMIDSPK